MIDRREITEVPRAISRVLESHAGPAFFPFGFVCNSLDLRSVEIVIHILQ
jgi:hypothetical protein